MKDESIYRVISAQGDGAWKPRNRRSLSAWLGSNSWTRKNTELGKYHRIERAVISEWADVTEEFTGGS